MVLLDTHTLIWYMFDSSKLSEAASDRIRDEEKVYYSMVSLWEILSALSQMSESQSQATSSQDFLMIS